MDAQKIQEIALANGFSLKEQASGNMDLHSYVYEFAQALIAEAQKVTELKANWIADCNKCGHADAVIYSTASDTIKGQFFDRDKVKCLHCGHTGEMNARGEDSDVVWDEFVTISMEEFESLKEFKDLYKRAIINAKKPKTELNWVHVKNLGVGSTRAFEILRSFNIDPEGTDMRIQQDTQGEN